MIEVSLSPTSISNHHPLALDQVAQPQMPCSSPTRLVRLSERSAERDLGGDDPISLLKSKGGAPVFIPFFVQFPQWTMNPTLYNYILWYHLYLYILYLYHLQSSEGLSHGATCMEIRLATSCSRCSRCSRCTGQQGSRGMAGTWLRG